MTTMIRTEGLAKTFTLHNHGGRALPVFEAVDFAAEAGECVALHGSSGSGKSSLMRCLYANYKPTAGRVVVRHQGEEVDITNAHPGRIVELRRRSLTFVTQFLRVIPRVPTLDIVAEPLIETGTPEETAHARAAELLERLRIPQALWSLAPATFSGGEQQRVNIARGFALCRPVMLLDEPTASLDEANRDTVIELILEARTAGAAVVGIFHDGAVRSRVADRMFPLNPQRAAA